MSQNLHCFGLNVCPHCGAHHTRLTSPVLRVPFKNSWWVPWFLCSPEYETEHLEVKCNSCDGIFKTRTYEQQHAVDGLRPYNEHVCPGCGGKLNQRDASGRITDSSHMVEHPDRLHGAGCITARCPYCGCTWQMKTFENTPNPVVSKERAADAVAPVKEAPEPRQGLVDLPEIRSERPLH